MSYEMPCHQIYLFDKLWFGVYCTVRVHTLYCKCTVLKNYDYSVDDTDNATALHAVCDADTASINANQYLQGYILNHIYKKKYIRKTENM